MHRVTRFRHQSQANLWSAVTLPLVTRAAMISHLEATVGQCHSTLLYIPRLLILGKKKKKKCDASLYNCGHVIISHYFNLGGAGKKKKKGACREGSQLGNRNGVIWLFLALPSTGRKQTNVDAAAHLRLQSDSRWTWIDKSILRYGTGSLHCHS